MREYYNNEVTPEPNHTFNYRLKFQQCGYCAEDFPIEIKSLQEQYFI